MHKKEINLALIAARKGSKGVKNKNLLNIKNKPITKIAVDIATKLKKIDNVILSSDSKKILNTVPNCKKLIKLKRKKKLSQDSTPMMPVMQDAIKNFEKFFKYKYQVKNLVIIDPTSPLRNLTEFNNALKKLTKLGPNCAMLRSLKKSSTHPYWMKTKINDDFLLKPFIEKMDENSFPNRQSLPDSYEISSEFDFAYVDQILKQNTFFPNPMYGFETALMPKIDIDSEEDFEIAELIYHKMGVY